MDSQLVLTWEQIEQFATIKHLKKQLTRKAKRQRLSKATWKTYRYWLNKFIPYTEKTPDELIEEAQRDPEETENLLIDFKNWCIDQGLDENVAINGTHGPVRGFFRHNNVNTINWKTPLKTERKVGRTDDNYPLFVRSEKNGKKKLVLNRPLLQEFQSKLNYRDQMILDCLISTGLDDGDLLKQNVDFVTSQNQPRLYLNNHRQKTLEGIHVFFSLVASKKLRGYVRKERADSQPDDPLFITTLSERKKAFRKQYGRGYKNEDLDLLPKGNRLTPEGLAINFRRAAEQFGIPLVKGQQSPLRPKRLRKVFETACTYAGVDPNIRDIFMGHKGNQSKTYEGKSREELEFYYELVEPKITIQVEESDEIEVIREESKKKISEISAKLEEYQKRELSDKDADKIIEQMRKTRPEWIRAVESAYEEVRKKTTIALNEEMKREFGMTDKDLEEFHVWKKGMIKKIKEKEKLIRIQTNVNNPI